MTTQQSSRPTERRRMYAWLVPIVSLTIGQAIVRADSVDLDLHDRWQMSAMFFAGLAGGALWQWIARRDLAERLAGLSTLFAVVMLLFLLPGEAAWDPTAAFAPCGLVAGLVLAENVLRRRTPGRDQQG
jgi:peptidoglycan/LPS O-acetylase OafA/YrhL